MAIGIVELDVADLLQPELGDDLAHRIALEIGMRGGAEDMGVALLGGELDRLRDRRDIDDALLARDLRDREADGRREPADQHIHAVLGNQLLGGGGGGGRLQLGVAGEAHDFLAEDAACGIEFVHGHIVAVHRRLAVNGSGSGYRVEHPDPDLVGLNGACSQHCRRRCRSKKRTSHGWHPPRCEVRLPRTMLQPRRLYARFRETSNCPVRERIALPSAARSCYEARLMASPQDFPARVLIGRLWRSHIRANLPALRLAALAMALSAAAQAGYIRVVQELVDEVLVAGNEALIVFVSLTIFALGLVQGFSAYFSAVILARVGQGVVASFQSAMFGHLVHADLVFFDNSRTGALISRFTNDVNLMRQALSTTLLTLGRDSLTIVFVLGVLFYQDWLLTLIVLFVFPTTLVLVLRIGRRIRRITSSAQTSWGEFTATLEQAVTGIRHIKAYRLEDRERREADAAIARIRRLAVKAVRVQAVSRPIMEFLGAVAVAAVIFYGGGQVAAGNITPGTVVAFLTAFLVAYRPVKHLVSVNAAILRGLVRRAALLRTAGPETRNRGCAGRSTPPRRPGRDRLRGRVLLLCRGAGGALRPFAHLPGGPHIGPGRGFRGRQDHDPQPHSALLRCRNRPGGHRRAGPADRHPRLAQGQDRAGEPGTYRCSTTAFTPISPADGRARRKKRSAPPRAMQARTTSSRPCRRATARGSASSACASRAASASASPLRAPC